MKFELTNLKQKFSDEDLINDLRAVAYNLGKKSLKMRDYCRKNGAKYNLKTAIKRFGNWDSTLKKAGLEGEKSLKGMEYGEKSIKDEVLLADILKVAKELSNSKITIRDYEKHGKFTAATMHARFGSWNKAKQKVNLETIGHEFTNEELFENILDLWTLLGRQPKYGEVVSPNSKVNGSTYARRFGSWRSALESFIEYVNSENNNNEEVFENKSQLIPINKPIENPKIPQKERKIKRTPRGINLRLRFTILKRDNFSCKKCGRSPAKDPSIILHVDHIIPWSKDGETVIDNLETLCEQCNLGKSNLL
jgi:hypothetical protein